MQSVQFIIFELLRNKMIKEEKFHWNEMMMWLILKKKGKSSETYIFPVCQAIARILN